MKISELKKLAGISKHKFTENGKEPSSNNIKSPVAFNSGKRKK